MSEDNPKLDPAIINALKMAAEFPKPTYGPPPGFKPVGAFIDPSVYAQLKLKENQMPERIQLPQPTFNDGLKVSEAIEKRRSIRQYDGHKLNLQTIANLCYFSAGMTDKERGFCANPTACNCHQIDLYIATDEYCAKYLPQEHALEIIERGDFRADMAIQPFAKEASIQFIYVVNDKSFEKFPGQPEHKVKYGHTDCAIMATNTCLYATSIGLGSVMRGMFDPEIVGKRLQIAPNDKIILTVSAG